ncbi:hypothetical protein [Methylobacterium sp.]|uniref:hypothetical protein n=1 Tax=Methylobacterium sp. TaxID=409 RepID=UPI00258748F4|nr:hypothetical protein [Methylobacterium sp.]
MKGEDPEGGVVQPTAPSLSDERTSTAHRVARELRRLEALAAKRRRRVRLLRGVRGGAGAAGTLALLLKLKLAGSLAVKLAVALSVGLVFAWPALGLGLLLVLAAVLWIASLADGSGGGSHGLWDLSCDCARREKRALRLATLIERRRSWLDDPSGPAPSPRVEAAIRRLKR